MNARELLAPDNDRDYIAWLGEVERRAIIPFKWLLYSLAVLHWMWVRQWAPPEVAPFALFVLAAMVTLAETYFISRDRITPRQVRPFVWTSFVLDAIFVTGLVALDAAERGMVPNRLFVSDYYLLFVIVVLRGFALFRSSGEHILGFSITSILFIVSAARDLDQTDVRAYFGSLQKTALLWGVMLLTQAFVGLVTAQRDQQMKERERLLRSESLGSLGEVTAGIAHEINNPIGIIRTYAEYLERSVQPDDPLREDFETIRRESQRCEDLVKRMLDFSEPRTQAFAEVPIEELVRETVAVIFRASHVESVVHVEPGLPAVFGDGGQLRQALINILLNARQILDDWQASGKAPEDFRPLVDVWISRGTGPRPPVRISIGDNGPGISHKDADRVFEPFFSRRAKGTGLGLAITRRIIDAHGGHISIAGREGGGALVTMEIPMAGEHAS